MQSNADRIGGAGTFQALCINSVKRTPAKQKPKVAIPEGGQRQGGRVTRRRWTSVLHRRHNAEALMQHHCHHATAAHLITNTTSPPSAPCSPYNCQSCRRCDAAGAPVDKTRDVKYHSRRRHHDITIPIPNTPQLRVLGAHSKERCPQPSRQLRQNWRHQLTTQVSNVFRANAPTADA